MVARGEPTNLGAVAQSSGLGSETARCSFAMLDFADPFDPRRAEAFMQEAGYRKGDGGFYESAEEGRLVFQILGSAGLLRERAVLADGWRRAGIDVEDRELSAGERRDGQVVATFRSMQISGAPPGLQAFGFFSSGTIPSAENRWVGGNLGGWSRSEYDRALEAVRTTLEPGARGRTVIELTRIASEHLPSISLYFVPWVNLLPAAVQGIDMRSGNAEQTWNIYQWELR